MTTKSIRKLSYYLYKCGLAQLFMQLVCLVQIGRKNGFLNTKHSTFLRSHPTNCRTLIHNVKPNRNVFPPYTILDGAYIYFLFLLFFFFFLFFFFDLLSLPYYLMSSLRICQSKLKVQSLHKQPSIIYSDRLFL